MAKEYIEKERFDYTLLLLGYTEKDLPRRALAQQATADVAPVVHGWWEPRKDAPGFCNCSVCHNCNVYDEWPNDEKWKYCPQCGAKMDLEVPNAKT